MPNQMIALQARAPQTDVLGSSIQRNAQMMNMMSQQRSAERQAAQAQQTMEFQAAEEARKAALHTPAMTKATAEAQAAQIETAMDFNNFVRVGLRYAQSPDQVIDIARKIAAQPQFKDDYFQHAIQVALQDMPSDPSQFPAWKDKTRFDTLSTDKQLSQKLIELTNGGETWTTAVPEYAGSGRAPAEVPGTRQKAPVGITYVQTPEGIRPMPKEATPGGLVGGDRGGDGYDVVFGFGKYGSPNKPLTGMSIGEVQDFQRNTLIPATRGKVGAGPDKGTGAVGKYQIVYSTLQEYAPKVLGANWKSQPFTPEVQERIAEAIYNDVRGGDLKKTWQGLPSNKPGEYANVPWSQVRDKVAQVESGGGRGAGSGIRMGEVIPGTKPKDSAGRSTEGERRFGTIAQQMRSNLKEAVSILQTNPDAIRPSTAEYVASQIPVYGEEARLFAESEPRQQLVASLLRFLDNVTYVNTGAGTSKTQEENYRRSYIPTFQDSDASAYRKLKSMVQFAQNVKAAAGVMWTPDMDADLTMLGQAVEQLAPKPKGQRTTGVDRNNPLLKGM